jgi:hypothetical protein
LIRIVKRYQQGDRFQTGFGVRSVPIVLAQVRDRSKQMVVLRASQIYSERGKPGRLPTGKSHFYSVIEPQLERVPLGPKAVGYTERSLNKLIERGIAEAAAARASGTAKSGACSPRPANP